ncbi:MAG: radical SAM protein [Nitrospinota bacterium]
MGAKENADSKLYVVSWNTTSRCNLKCDHCYLDAETLDKGKDDISTEEGYRLIDQIALNNPSAILILTGGEPLMRDDIFLLGKHAKDKGLMPVLGTNGTLLTEEVCDKLVENGIPGVGVSIDSLNPALHDGFRGVDGALEKTIKGLEIAKSRGLDFQVQTTVTKFNIDEIEDIINFSVDIGCRIYNLFFLVCTGRGQEVSDISPEEYEQVLLKLVTLQEKFEGKIIIKAKCAPHFKRVAYQQNPDSSLLKGYTTDCLAGKHYARVDQKGNVTPCPYMPEAAGTILESGFDSVWKSSELFQSFRAPEYTGKCGKCDYRIICGGCRARAFATTGSYLDDDPWCIYEPPEGESKLIVPETEEKYWENTSFKLSWNKEAEERLGKVPFFARQMAVKAVERYAKENKISLITPEVMAKSREKSSVHMGAMGNGPMGDMKKPGPMAMFKAFMNKGKKI